MEEMEIQAWYAVTVSPLLGGETADLDPITGFDGPVQEPPRWDGGSFFFLDLLL